MDQIVRGPTVVCSALLEREGLFLLVFCPRFKVWRAPGGRAEFSETLEKTLIREMQEELGIKLIEPYFVGWGQDNQFHVKDQKETSRLIMFFHCKSSLPLQIDPDECEQHKWVTAGELLNHPNKEGALEDFFKRNPYWGNTLG